MIEEEETDKQYTDTAGQAQEVAPGPRGQRMMQLGLLTKMQKRKPKMPKIGMNAEGKANPADVENAKLQSTLAQKAMDQKMAILQKGPSNQAAERDPMKTSLYRQAQMMKR